MRVVCLRNECNELLSRDLLFIEGYVPDAFLSAAMIGITAPVRWENWLVVDALICAIIESMFD